MRHLCLLLLVVILVALSPAYAQDSQSPITPANAAQVALLDTWGYGTVNDLAWSPDGDTLAVAGGAGVWLYTAFAPGIPPGLLRGSGSEVAHTANYSPDGSLIAISVGVRYVSVRDAATGAEQFLLEDSRRPVFSPDGQTLATQTYDGIVYRDITLWDIASGSERLVIPIARPVSMAFSGDGSVLAISGDVDDQVRLWDVDLGREFSRVDVPGVKTVAFARDGFTLVASSRGDIRLFGLVDDSLRTIDGYSLLAVSPDGQTLAALGDGRTVHLLDAQSGDGLAVLDVPLDDEARALAFSPDGQTLAYTSPGPVIRLVDVASGGAIAALDGHTMPLSAVAFSPDGAQIITGNNYSRLQYWDCASGEPVSSITGPQWNIHSIAFSPDGQMMATGGFGSAQDDVVLWDVASGDIQATLPGKQGRVYHVAFSADGTLLAALDGWNSIALWQAPGWDSVPAPDTYASAMQFAPQGAPLYLVQADDAVLVWEDGRLRSLPDAPTEPSAAISDMAIDPAGRTLAVAHYDGTVTLVDAATNQQLATLVMPEETVVSAVTFNAAGTLLASASWDGAVRLWDAATGTELAVLADHTLEVTGLAFSADDTLLVSASHDGTLRLWGVAE